MSKIPTAEEFFISKLNPNATGGLYKIETDYAIKLGIEFAKLHVEAALKAAAENAIAIPSEEDIEEYVDKNSILNAYPLENIK